MSRTSTSRGTGRRAVRRLVGGLVALVSAVAVGMSPAVATPADGGPGGGGGGGSWSVTDGSASDTTASYAPAKGDPSIWPKPNEVRVNLSDAQSRQMVEDCPLYSLCVRNQEADSLWSAYALYYCLPAGQYYELTNFTGTVYAQNSQTVTARFLAQNDAELDRIGANSGKNISWNPVWKIDLC